MLTGDDGSDGNFDDVWECYRKRKGSGTDGCCCTDDKGGFRVQRSAESSSQVREIKKNLAYQLAQDPVIWAAYMLAEPTTRPPVRHSDPGTPLPGHPNLGNGSNFIFPAFFSVILSKYG